MQNTTKTDKTEKNVRAVRCSVYMFHTLSTLICLLQQFPCFDHFTFQASERQLHHVDPHAHCLNIALTLPTEPNDLIKFLFLLRFTCTRTSWTRNGCPVIVSFVHLFTRIFDHNCVWCQGSQRVGSPQPTTSTGGGKIRVPAHGPCVLSCASALD